jgi:hypothetical protein
MAYGAFHQDGEGSAPERCLCSAPASCCADRSSATLVTQVRTVRTSSISIPAGGFPAGWSGGSDRGHGRGYLEASAAHGRTVTEACEKQRLDHRRDRDRRAERLPRCCEETWLSRVPRADLFKSMFPIRLIAYSSRSLRRPTIFWCPVASVRSVGA